MKKKLKYSDSKKILEESENLQRILKTKIETAFSTKLNKFPKEAKMGKLELLINENILVTNDNINYYYFDFEDSLSCTILLDYAIQILERTFPESPYEAADFIQDFLSEICKPKINHHWYTMEVGRNFRNFVFLEYEEFFISNYEELKDILFNDHPHRSNKDYLKIYLDQALPSFNFTSNQFFEIAYLYQKDKHSQGKSFDLLDEVSSKSLKIANELLELAKIEYNKSGETYFLRPVIISLSKYDIDKAIEESLKLLKDPTTEIIGLNCIGWLNYLTEEQILNCFESIRTHQPKNEEYYSGLPRMYRNLIENNLSTASTKEKIIDEFWHLLDTNSSDEVLNQIRYWIESISGFEEEKMKFLFAFLDRGVSIDFWHFFQKFNSPSYLFEFIKSFYASVGLRANINQFKNALDTFQRKNPEEFKKELANLLSSDYGILRKAGVDILTSRHWGVHDADLLSLDKIRQSIVIDTLLSIPFQIDKILPFIIQLKDSPFPEIRELLINHIVQLVFSYEELIIDLLNPILKSDDTNDVEILEKVNDTWSNYKEILDKKRRLLELNPFVNQRHLTESYYRKEQEYKVEQMEQAHKDTSLLKMGIARNIPVIRGSAFKMEGENQSINKLGKVETIMHIDKRYYINPSAYELNFQNHILNKNYSEKSDEGNNS